MQLFRRIGIYNNKASLVDCCMSEEEKDPVEIVKISDEEEELDPEEIKELESIIEEVTGKPEEESEGEAPEEQTVEEQAPTPIQEDIAEKESPKELPVPEATQLDPDEPASSTPEAPTITAADLGGSQEIGPAPPPVVEKAPIITNHVVPSDECWLLKRNRTGFTLPKEIRERIHPQQNFALVVEGHELAFYMINEEDIPKLRLARKKVEPRVKGKRGKRGKKKKEGPEPDFPRYFHFELEDQSSIQDAIESAFYKFAETPPKVGEAMNIVIYVLTSFVKNHRMNDSRLRQTVIFFLCHIIEQFNQPQLIDFIQREIIEDVSSAYLYQICLNQMAYTSFIMDKPEKADEFIKMCVEVINKYDITEMYAIMDSFKHLIHTLTPIQGKNITKEELGHVKSFLDEYFDKLEDVDYQIQYLELLERMDYVEDAYNKAQIFMNKLDLETTPESIRDQFKEIRRRLSHQHV